MVSHITAALPDAVSVVHRTHPFYDARYDYVIQREESRVEKYRRLYGGPILLAWLLHRARGVIYIGSSGFLLNGVDEREFEFSFIKRRGRQVVCYFTGNDIRSPLLMSRLALETGAPNLGSKLADLDPVFMTDEYDATRKRRAEVADTYADEIFNARVDQLSYITRPTHPFLYFYPDADFAASEDKFDGVQRFTIVHAPSKPVLKGTSHVRAAIERLRAERDDFEYRELIDVSNAEVLNALSNAHIALNEFYSFVPGVFGIEAMARMCVMLTSADPAIETDLGPDAANAWIVTPVDHIYAEVSALLDDPERMRRQARAGFQWAWEHASATACTRSMREILDLSE